MSPVDSVLGSDAHGVLAAGITAAATSFTIESGYADFPTADFGVSVGGELMTVGSRSGATFSSLTRPNPVPHNKWEAVLHVATGAAIATVVEAGPGGSLPVDLTPGGTQAIITSTPLPNAKITADVAHAPNLGAVRLDIHSDDAGEARLFVADEGTKDGVISVSTATGIYAQPRSDASAGSTIVEVTDTGGNDAFVVENDGKIGFFGHAPAAQQTGVAVDVDGIHAALVALGLITA